MSIKRCSIHFEYDIHNVSGTNVNAIAIDLESRSNKARLNMMPSAADRPTPGWIRPTGARDVMCLRCNMHVRAQGWHIHVQTGRHARNGGSAQDAPDCGSRWGFEPSAPTAQRRRRSRSR